MVPAGLRRPPEAATDPATLAARAVRMNARAAASAPTLAGCPPARPPVAATCPECPAATAGKRPCLGEAAGTSGDGTRPGPRSPETAGFVGPVATAATS